MDYGKEEDLEHFIDNGTKNYTIIVPLMMFIYVKL
jgi:hypothetical protein